jgi:hypothetical protein
MQLQAWGQIRDGTGDLSRQSQGEADGVTPAGFFFGERGHLFRRTECPIYFAHPLLKIVGQLIEPSSHRAIGGLICNATSSDELTLNSDKVVQHVHLGGLPFIRRERNTLSHRQLPRLGRCWSQP